MLNGKTRWSVMSVFLVLIIMLTAVVSCSGGGEQTTLAPGETISLKVSNYFPAPAGQSGLLEEFCKDLEDRTEGRVKIDYFAGGSLLGPTDMFDGVVDGVSDIGYSHVFYTPGRMPVTEVIGLPLGYPSAWVGTHVINDFYEKFTPKEFDDVVVLLMNVSPPSAIATRDVPIRSLADLKGLTIRAPGLAGDVMKALGGTPAPNPMPEVYDAISKGVLDGESSNYETLAAFKFAEVVNYSTSIWQVTHPYPFYLVMNKDSYAKLPADIKATFDQLVGEYRDRYALLWNSVDFVGKAAGVANGVEFIDLPDSEVAKFVAAVQPVIDNYKVAMEGKGYSASEIDGWIQFIKDRIAYWTDKQIAYRIPSAAGPPEVRPEALIP